jgi:putative membrane protein
MRTGLLIGAAAAVLASAGVLVRADDNRDRRDHRDRADRSDRADRHGDRPVIVGNNREWEKQFIRHAHWGNLREVEISNLAESRASSPDVKALAREMIRVHSQADREIAALAKGEDVRLPDRPMEFLSLAELASWNAETKAVNRLSALTGADFDREYLALQKTLHVKTVSLFQAADDVITDRDVKAAIAKWRPEFERHTMEIINLRDRLEGRSLGVPSGGTVR